MMAATRQPGLALCSAASRAAGARRRGRAKGTVLIVTMWILVVLAGMVLVLARSMRVEGTCSANHAAGQQAAAVEHGAIQYVLASLDGLNGWTPGEANMPAEAVRIGEGAFWIIRPGSEEGREQAYGVVDEASKLNLNTATQAMLSALPGMTPEIAAALVDWRDADSELTVGGAESEYYLLLPDPYECKNAPLETVEELLLVKLMSRDVLLGEDINRNGKLDENENDADATDPPDNRNGKLDAGILHLVTVYSSEPGNGGSSGSSRPVDVNRARTGELTNVLGSAVPKERLADVLTRARLGRPFENVLDFYYRTGLRIEEFRAVAGRLTTRGTGTVRGLINIATAPRAVLLCLPGLEDSDASALISARSGDNADRDNLAWVAEALAQEKAVGIGSLITTKSYQFSADIVSVCGNGRAFRRCRIVVDAQNSPPRVIYRQDLTPLGWPLSQELLAELRAGKSLDELLKGVRQEVR